MSRAVPRTEASAPSSRALVVHLQRSHYTPRQSTVIVDAR